jgi:two-component system, OmpR family, copper resistance phosphate regulon response regulator CusR
MRTQPVRLVMVVEDDPKGREALRRGLSEAGYETLPLASAEDALRALQTHRPHLIVLDIGLPGADGYAVLREARQRYGSLPVLVLTARDGVAERVAGLDAGADDYLVKPFAFAELLARVRARLRPRDPSATTHIADLTIDPVARRARRGSAPLDLTPLEFDLLRFLAENAGAVVTRDMLASAAWPVVSRATPIDNLLQVHLSHLRSKVDGPGQTPLIHTVRGLGYIMEPRP